MPLKPFDLMDLIRRQHRYGLNADVHRARRTDWATCGVGSGGGFIVDRYQRCVTSRLRETSKCPLFARRDGAVDLADASSCSSALARRLQHGSGRAG